MKVLFIHSPFIYEAPSSRPDIIKGAGRLRKTVSRYMDLENLTD
jgi:hypothetical protein